MAGINVPIREFSVLSEDGTRIRAYVCGTGPTRCFLSPGMGTPLLCWKYLFEAFHEKLTFVTWDPRGCYKSERPQDLTHAGVPDHLADGVAVLGEMGWEDKPFVAMGWSMGVELSLEMYAKYTNQINGLVLINGAFEYVLETVTMVPFPELLLPNFIKAGMALGPRVTPLVRSLLSQDWTISVLKNAGIVTDNREFFGEVLRDFRDLDFAFYIRMIRDLHYHSSRHVLPLVRVPTLITAGTKDKMTPVSVARDMHQRIYGSELFIIPNGTHYTTLEYPEIVNLKLEQFFRRHFSEGG